MNRAPKVFLSYASEDRAVVDRIFQVLEDGGCNPWMDTEVLLPGQAWELQIHKAIEASDFFVACLSTTSVNKIGYVQVEFKKGLERAQYYPEGAVFVVPLRLDNCAIPQAFAAKHCLNWFDPEAPAKLLQVIHPERFAPASFMKWIHALGKPDTSDAGRKLAALELAQAQTPLALMILSERYYHEPDATIRYWLAVSIGGFQTTAARNTLLDLRDWENARPSSVLRTFALMGIEAGLKLCQSD